MRSSIICLIGLLLFTTQNSFSQTEMSVFSATGRAGVATTLVADYHTLGINTANLGFEDRLGVKVVFGFAEVGASIFSDALGKSELKDAFLQLNPSQLTEEQKSDAAFQFTNKGIAMNVDIMPIGINVNLNEYQIGGLAFSVRGRINSYIKLNDFTSNILFKGFHFSDYFDTLIVDPVSGDTLGIAGIPKRISEVMQGTRINFSVYTEYNFGYGRRLFANEKITLYGGLGIKLIQGYGILDINFENGTFEGFGSITPAAKFDFGSISVPSLDTLSGLKPSGKGTGFEFGLVADFDDRFKVGASIVDIGSITWTGNVVSMNDAILDSLNFSGFNSYNILLEIADVLGSGGFFDIQGLQNKKIKLPTKLRLGGSMVLYDDMLVVGIDVIIPMNNAIGNYVAPVIGVGGDFSPFKQLALSSGFTFGGNYNFNVPFGFLWSFGPKRNYEFGMATRDLLTYFGQNKPTISASAGLLRFKI
ncbi:MAG: hypothetical protein IIA45_15550 [Bacteroidetes bacterium]|nr:hypothetical protein [Bacteroidota bacterium]